MRNINLLIIILPFTLLFGCTSELEPMQNSTPLIESSATPEPTEVPTNTPIPEPTLTPIPAGSFGTPECEEFKPRFGGRLSAWFDAWKLAQATPRVSLPSVVSELQQIRREIAAMDEPSCSSELGLQAKTVNMMDNGIDALLAFLAEEGNPGTCSVTPRDIAMHNFSIYVDLTSDALDALSEETNELPKRIHYVVTGETFAGYFRYLADDGELAPMANDEGYDYIGSCSNPSLASAILPQNVEPLLSFEIDQAGENEGESSVNCQILVNGEIIVEKTFKNIHEGDQFTCGGEENAYMDRE